MRQEWATCIGDIKASKYTMYLLLIMCDRALLNIEEDSTLYAVCRRFKNELDVLLN